jgi:hypothetical protein
MSLLFQTFFPLKSSQAFFSGHLSKTDELFPPLAIRPNLVGAELVSSLFVFLFENKNIIVSRGGRWAPQKCADYAGAERTCAEKKMLLVQ